MTQPPSASFINKAAARILALPHVQSLEREPDGWCCYLHPGLTTEALGGGGTIIDTSLAVIWSYVKGPAQQM